MLTVRCRYAHTIQRWLRLVLDARRPLTNAYLIRQAAVDVFPISFRLVRISRLGQLTFAVEY